MNLKAYSIILVLLTSLLCGCVSNQQEIIEDNSVTPPERMSFTAPVMSSDSNNAPAYTSDRIPLGDPQALLERSASSGSIGFAHDVCAERP